ncbi:pyridoxal phosphate-dependent transferase [Lentinula raphanica]|nr:pyridoxal phosphate-dependent transferase [Lentinula raphanica]
MPGFQLPPAAKKADDAILVPILNATPPKAFGTGDARSLFMLDDEYTNLNHGKSPRLHQRSFGSVPKAVHEASELLSRHFERNPDWYIREEHPARVDAARAVVAEHLGVDQDTCVFVPSVAAGMATVLRNLSWTSRDVIVCSDVIYDTISSSVKEICQGESSPHRSIFKLQLPLSHSSIIGQFKQHLNSLQTEMEATSRSAGTPLGKIVVIIESITSSPGILMPWQEMVRICRDENVWSVVDAAHSLGQEVDLDIGVVDPDFWLTDGAKWGYAKRGCGILYVPYRNQDMITSAYLPGLIFGGPELSTRFVWQFYWSGLSDPVPPISITYALKFRQQIGGEKMIQKYCHELAMSGGRRMAQIMNTTMLDSSAENSGEVVANMVNVELPLSHTIRPSGEVYHLFSQELFETHKVFATCFVWQDKWWTRVSAQIYNQMDDFERLARALLEICRKIAKD